MSTIVVKFDNTEDATKVDLTRVGIVAGASADRRAVIVEPQIDAADDIAPRLMAADVAEAIVREALQAGMAACGVFAEVLTREEYETRDG